MNDRKWKPRKVVVVGAGDVGSTFAYSLAQSGLADEIALIDHNNDLLNGQVLDLSHGLTFFPTVNIYAGGISDYSDAHIIVIAAGAKQRPGESRINLVKRNAAIVEDIVGDIAVHNSHGVIVMVSNPVDILTHVALRRSGWERGRVIGSGTVLDSARFRYLLSRHCRVDVHNVHAYILGEHGDSEFAAWSLTHIAGMAIDEYCPRCCRCDDWNKERQDIFQMVRDSAYHIINYKGATYYAIGLALVQIARAILRNQRSVLTVSTSLNGEYGLEDVCLSLPCMVTQNGVEYIMEFGLSPVEFKALAKSSALLRDVLAEI